MKEVIVSKGPSVKIVDIPIHLPGPGQIVVKIKAAAANPKDWKLSDWWFPDRAVNEGEDAAGTIHALGDGITGFAIGDRVAFLHSNSNPGGGYAEYGIANPHATFHIPQSMSFEEASTIPMGVMTAALGLYQHLNLPPPWLPGGSNKAPLPLVVTGGSTVVGAFAIKLAALAGVHPIITTAGAGAAFVQTLLDPSKGDTIIDYRSDKGDLHDKIAATIPVGVPVHIFEGVGDAAALLPLLRKLGDRSVKLALSLPFTGEDSGEAEAALKEAKAISSTSIQDSDVWGPARAGGKAFAAVMSRYVDFALHDGSLKGHPYSIRPGGLDGVLQMLLDLKAGKASAEKFVVQVA